MRRTTSLAQAILGAMGVFNVPARRNVTPNGPHALVLRLSRSKYQPHGGKGEAARRVRQMNVGMLQSCSRGLA